MPLGEPAAAAPVVGSVPRTATVLQVLTHARIGGLARHAARQAFEDEVIDRLFVLNAERAKEEERAGLTVGKKCKKIARKKASKRDDGGQQSLV
jgi:hypothetical protein